MDEHVEREKLLTDICDDMCGFKYTGVCENCRVVALIADAPAADVAPVVHAHWVVRFDGPYKRRRCYCSHCGKHNGVGGIVQNQEKPYCPNCGAKMDGAE